MMNNQPVIFCIPGLGLDRRMFERLDLHPFQVEYLDWIEPQGWETLEIYARRLAGPILECQSEVIIIGHSFGGVVAQEISCITPVKQIILISSTIENREMPWRLRLLSRYSLYKLVTRTAMLASFTVWSRTHGFRTRELRTIFRESVGKLSTHYFHWSLKRLADWNGVQQTHTPTVRIHGTKDLTFPRNLIRHIDHEVHGGDHAMVHRRAGEVSARLHAELRKLSVNPGSVSKRFF